MSLNFFRTYILFLLLFVLPIHNNAQFFYAKENAEKRKIIIEKLSLNTNMYNDKQDVEQSINSYFQDFKLKDESFKQIITSVYKAKIVAAKEDQINNESNTLFKKAIDLATKKDDTSLKIWTSLSYGFYLYTYRQYDESYPHFVYCIQKLNEINPNEIIQPLDTYKKISYFLVTANENDLSIKYLKEAERIADPLSHDMGAIKDGMGICYLNKNDFKSAEKYFSAALKISKLNKDKLREAKVYGNLGEMEFQKGNYRKAVELITKDIEISRRQNTDKNTMFALIKLCKAHLKLKNISEAKVALYEAEKIAETKSYYKSSLLEINEYLLEIAKLEGKTDNELKIRQNLEILENTLKTMDGKDVLAAVGWKTERNRLEYNIALEKDRAEKESTIKTFAIVISILLLIVILLLARSFQIRTKARETRYEKKLLQLTLDKIQSENNLNATAQTVSSYKNYLLEKNSQIEKLEKEIENNRLNPTSNQEKYVSQIDDLLKSHLLTQENWINFKNAFYLEKPIYSKYLDENFPDLTDANLRVIYLTQLELNNTEIARILGVTLAAVKKTKQRLRLKYGEKYDTLFEITA